MFSSVIAHELQSTTLQTFQEFNPQRALLLNGIEMVRNDFGHAAVYSDRRTVKD